MKWCSRGTWMAMTLHFRHIYDGDSHFVQFIFMRSRCHVCDFAIFRSPSVDPACRCPASIFNCISRCFFFNLNRWIIWNRRNFDVGDRCRWRRIRVKHILWLQIIKMKYLWKCLRFHFALCTQRGTCVRGDWAYRKKSRIKWTVKCEIEVLKLRMDWWPARLFILLLMRK